MLHRRRDIAILSVSLALIAVMTLLPTGDQVAHEFSFCVICGDLGGTDAFLNVLLFVPLGIGLGLMRVRSARGVLVALALSGTVEALQYQFIPGRDASLGDLITNTLGGALGLGLVRWSALWIWGSPRAARCMTLMWGGAYLAIQSLGAWGSGLEFPPGPFWGQWQPAYPGTGVFGGALIAARLRHMPLPRGRIADSVGMRRDLLREPSVFTALVIPGPPTRALAPIARVVNAKGSEALLLAQRNTSLVFAFPMRATVARLRRTLFALEGAFPTLDSKSARSPADTLQLSAVALHDRVHLAAESRHRRADRNIVLSPSMTWTFVLPFEYAVGSSVRPLSALWLAVLLCPFGFWSWRSTVPRESLTPRTRRALPRLIGLGFMIEVLGLAAVPLAFGLEISHWSEWAGASMGVAIGWLGGIAIAAATTNPGYLSTLTWFAKHDPGEGTPRVSRGRAGRSVAREPVTRS